MSEAFKSPHAAHNVQVLSLKDPITITQMESNEHVYFQKPLKSNSFSKKVHKKGSHEKAQGRGKTQPRALGSSA